MQSYAITMSKKTGLNEYAPEIAVGTIDADLLGMAKRAASEYINQWLIDKKLTIRTKTEWVKDVKRQGQSREFMVSDGQTPAKLIFILREN